MSATQNASTSIDLYNVWTDILNTYLGKSCVHTKISKTLDLNGNVIDESETSTTIYGAVSPVKAEAVLESAGAMIFGDLVAYFMTEEGVLVGTQTNSTEARHDTITYEGNVYTVENKRATAYDAGVAVVDKFVLRKVAFQ